MSNIPTILCCTNFISQYDALPHFLQTYLTEFKQRGYSIYDVNEQIPLQANNKNSFAFFIGQIPSELYEWLNVHFPLLPIINLYVDHPYYYFPFTEKTYPSYCPLLVMPDWTNALKNASNPLIAVANQTHISYHSITSNSVPPSQQTRTIDVLFTGSFTLPETIEQQFRQEQEKIYSVFKKIVSILENRENFELDTFIQECLVVEEQAKTQTFRFFYTYIDKYIRNLYRLKTLQALANTNIKVHYYGNSPKLLADILKSPANFYFNEAISFEETLKLMQNSKIVLTSAYQNNMALLSERSLSAMANGAVSIHGKSPFLNSLLKEGEEVISFSWLNDLEQLPQTIEQLLADTEKRQFIADNGQKKARTEFSVSTSVNRLLEKIELFRQQYYSLILK